MLVQVSDPITHIASSALVKRVQELEGLLPDREQPEYARTRTLISSMVSELESPAFSASDKDRIYDALELAIRLHSRQGMRLDGQPYVNHILDVPLNLMRTLEIRKVDSVIAAILHDVVEDQAQALLREYGSASGEEERQLPLRTQALTLIERRYGNTVRMLVDKLTNEDFISLGQRKREQFRGGPREGMTVEHHKLRLYQKKVVKLGEALDPISQDAFAVKIADFLDNAMRHDSLPAVTSEEREKKKWLSDKRGPLFVYFVRVLFPRLPETHPLFKVRDKLKKHFQDYYREQYLRPG